MLPEEGLTRTLELLARELSLQQIAHISQNTRVPLEFFIHGALCVSYSGQCYMSHHLNRRSANRGECSQPCRQAYDLQTKDGKTLVRDQHLLSLKDLNLSNQLRQLVDAGAVIYRNQNNDFERQVDKSRETRKIAIRLLLKQQGSTFSLQLTDEDGLQSEVQQTFVAEPAEKAEKSLQQIQQQLAKWGGTPFVLESLVCDWQQVPFLPAGFLNQLRRQAGEKHLHWVLNWKHPRVLKKS